jgi:hypothetical protein
MVAAWHLDNSSIFATGIDGSQYFFSASSSLELQEVTNMKINAMTNKEFFIFSDQIRLNTESEQKKSHYLCVQQFKKWV